MKHILVLCVCAVLLCPGIVCAEDKKSDLDKIKNPGVSSEKFEDTAVGKAAKETLEQMTNLINDWTEMNSMTLEQKIEYVRKNAKKRAWDKAKDQAWGKIKNVASDYAKEKMREGLFQQELPKMIHLCIVERKNVAQVWTDIDAHISSTLDTRANAISRMFDAVEISYGAYKKWSEGKPDEAISDTGKAIADKIMECIVPGWGYYRLAQGLVEALGKWVMQYAFDAALESKIKAISPVDPKTNPEQFAAWLLTVKDIAGFVSREWEEQIGYYMVAAAYDGDATTQEEWGASMKQKIIQVLTQMQTEAREKKAIEEELRRKFEEQQRKVRAAAEKVQQAALKNLEDIEKALAPLRVFEEKVYGLKKQDVKVVIQQQEEAYQAAQEEVEDPGAYSAMNRGAIINALHNKYNQVGETFDRGYDVEEMMKQGELAGQIAAEEHKRLSDQIAQADKEWKDAVQAQMKATQPLSIKIANTWREYVGKRMPDEVYQQLQEWQAEVERVSNSFAPQLKKAINKQTSVQRLAAQDKALLAAEEQLVIAEAQERFTKMMKALAPQLAVIQQDLKIANEQFHKAYAEYEAEKAKLNYPDMFDYVGSDMFSSYGYIPAYRSFPQEIQPAISQAEIALQKWREDAMNAPRVYALFEKLHKDYELQFQQCKNQFESLVGEKVRTMNEYVWQANVYNFVEGVTVPEEGFSIQLPPVTVPPLIKKDVAGAYKKAVNELEPRVNELRELEPSVDIAVGYWLVLERIDLRNYESWALQKIDMYALAEKKGDEVGWSVNPDDSDGAAFVASMKEAWEKNKPLVERLVEIRNDFLKAQVMKFEYGDPRQDGLLDEYLAIPKKIAEYEAIIAGVYDKRAKLIKGLRDAEETLKKQYSDILEKHKDYRDAIKLLHPLLNDVKSQSAQIPNRKGLPEEVMTLLEKMDVFQKTVDGKINELQELVNRGIYTGSFPDSRPLSPEGANGYSLEEVLFNGMPGGMLPPMIQLTSQDLKKGKMPLSVRLSSTKGITEIMFMDGAGGEYPLKIKKNLDCSFSPEVNKIYSPSIRITDEQGGTVTFPLFPQVNSITYVDINVEQLVVESVGKLLTAYEEQNSGTFSQYVARDFLGNSSTLEEAVRFDWSVLTDIKIAVRIERIEKRGQWNVAETAWERSQIVRDGGIAQKKQGRTTLMFVYEDSIMKLKNMRGALLFAIMSPEMGQLSGLGQKEIEKIRKAQEVKNPEGPVSSDSPDVPGDAEEEDESAPLGGGSLQKGNATLQQFNAHPMMLAGGVFAHSFRFSTGEVLQDTAFPVTGDFRRREGYLETGDGAGLIDLGSLSLSSITEVPEGGYQQAITPYQGHSYACKCSDGTYAVFEITFLEDSIGLYEGRAISTKFSYIYQPNGSRSFE